MVISSISQRYGMPHHLYFIGTTWLLRFAKGTEIGSERICHLQEHTDLSTARLGTLLTVSTRCVHDDFQSKLGLPGHPHVVVQGRRCCGSSG